MRICLSILVSLLAAALLAGCGSGASSQNQGGNATASSTSNNPADYLGALVQAKKTADKTIDVSYLNQALQLFNVQEGRYPKDLKELTPKYVAQIPDAPLGCKIVYDAVKGEVKVVKQ
jgi:ABC-type Fe3+-hydroxamate transport system substrate-binding protein